MQENLQTLTLEVTVADEDELPVSERGTASLHPASFYIGVRSEAWAGRAGMRVWIPHPDYRLAEKALR